MAQNRSRAKNGTVVLDAFAASLFWGYVAIAFGSTELQTAQFVGFGPEHTALIFGNIFALAAVGLLGPRARESHLFALGFAGALAAGMLHIISIGAPLAPLFPWSRLLTCGASAILVLAWCERIASKTVEERSLFLALTSSFTIAIILLFLQLEYRYAALVCKALFIASAAIGVRQARKAPASSTSSTEQPWFPPYLIVILFVFGFMISFLSILNWRAVASPQLSLPSGADPFLAVWTVLVLLVAAAAWILLPSHRTSLLTTILVPLASLGLLLPPYLHYGLRETLPAIIAFIVVCETIICSVGPTNAKKAFRVGGIAFVFWIRSVGLIGMVIGYVAGIALFDLAGIAIDYDVSLAIFIAYAILCLTVAVVLGRIGLRMPSRDKQECSPVAAARSLAERYRLTARETEVLELVAQGRNMTYVQKVLHISPGTSSTHINHIHQKLGVHSREELIDLVQEEMAC